MFTAKQFRAKAAESEESLKRTEVPSEIRRFKQAIQNFTELAQNEEWLADNFDKIIRSQDSHLKGVTGSTSESESIAAVEEHILRCLGAAVILQWNTIPTKLQRELFDTAGSMGDLLQTGILRGQIARFLHKHKDDVSASVGGSDIPKGRVHDA